MYKIVEKSCEVEGEVYTAYGVEGGGLRVDDITSNFEQISDFTNICNTYDVSSIHIEDMISELLY